MEHNKNRAIREQFPFLQVPTPPIYLDNAATTQVPQIVLDAMVYYYKYSHSNVHRSIHARANRATEQIEGARQSVQQFIHAQETKEIIFTSGTTEGINAIASHFTARQLKEGDEILLSQDVHYSHLLPWEAVAKQQGATLSYLPLTDEGVLTPAQLKRHLKPHTKIVALNHRSNVLGTTHPIAQLTRVAHEVGAIVVVDAAQSIAHQPIDVQQIDCDFLLFSGHKLYGPTGIGVLYGKNKHLAQMKPWKLGGGVYTPGTPTYAPLPHRLEGGTPNLIGIIGLQAAIQWLQTIGWRTIEQHETRCYTYLLNQLKQIEGIQLLPHSPNHTSLCSFILKDIHPLDLALHLDQTGIALRIGTHCAQPLFDAIQLPQALRISLALYNNLEEIDELIQQIHHTQTKYRKYTSNQKYKTSKD